MNRARLASAAALSSFLAAALFLAPAVAGAQQPPAPELHQVLAGRTFTPPIRGEAALQVALPPQQKREGDIVVTKFTVKNISSAPIARLTIDEPWYDKSGAVVAGGRGIVSELLQPNEVKTVTVETQYTPKMMSNNYQFSHANGTIKIQKVAKIDAPAAEKENAPAKGGKK